MTFAQVEKSDNAALFFSLFCCIELWAVFNPKILKTPLDYLLIRFCKEIIDRL